MRQATGFSCSTDWYASLLDGRNIEVNGVGKWDSRIEAEVAAQEFLDALSN